MKGVCRQARQRQPMSGPPLRQPEEPGGEQGASEKNETQVNQQQKDGPHQPPLKRGLPLAPRTIITAPVDDEKAGHI